MKESNCFFDRRSLIVLAILFLAFLGLLVLEQRPAWCKYGFGLWSAAWQHCTSQHLLDPYSMSHVLHGIIFYWALRPFAAKFAFHWRLVAAVALEIGWELLENSPWVVERYRQQTASLDYTGDSILNSVGDVLATIVGFAFASRFTWKASVIVFIAFELWALYLAKDNLILNVLMLFFPLESIKQWQLG
jgi:hypothetical protein